MTLLPETIRSPSKLFPAIAPTPIATATSVLLGGPTGLGFWLQEEEMRIFEDGHVNSRLLPPSTDQSIELIDHGPWKPQSPFADAHSSVHAETPAQA